MGVRPRPGSLLSCTVVHMVQEGKPVRRAAWPLRFEGVGTAGDADRPEAFMCYCTALLILRAAGWMTSRNVSERSFSATSGAGMT